jgi:two-component system OmpR family sensor kinase
VVQATGLPPDSPRTDPPALGIDGGGFTGSWPGWLDLAWVALWLCGLTGIMAFERWEGVPFRLIWITTALLVAIAVISWALMWHGRRLLAADAECVRISTENQRLLAIQRRFLQDASHQLRTPITIALGHSELLARSLADNQDKRDINVIVGELNRLRTLSDRLLLIAASENPDFLRPEPVALDQLTMEVIRGWRPAADRRWVLGQLDAATVSADRERLRLAVDALLENATQHTAAGDMIRLSVVRSSEPPFARMIIEDSGEGIPAGELSSIFERFATGPGTAGRRGTGLGLALVRAVAHGHGGEVRVHSVEGAGSRFELVLPALPVAYGPTAAPDATTGAAITRTGDRYLPASGR